MGDSRDYANFKELFDRPRLHVAKLQVNEAVKDVPIKRSVQS